jgi:hypothetical protein
VRYAVWVSALTDEIPLTSRGISLFPYMFEFWTKSECSSWLKFWFQQPIIGRFKHTTRTNFSSHAPTPRVTASWPVKFSSYIVLLFPKICFSARSLTSFLPHFLSGQQLLVTYSLSLSLFLRHDAWPVFRFIKSPFLNINSYTNVRNLTILH